MGKFKITLKYPIFSAPLVEDISQVISIVIAMLRYVVIINLMSFASIPTRDYHVVIVHLRK